MTTSDRLPIREPLKTFLRLTPWPTTASQPLTATQNPSTTAAQQVSQPQVRISPCTCTNRTHSAPCPKNPYLVLTPSTPNVAPPCPCARSSACATGTTVTLGTDGTIDEIEGRTLVKGEEEGSALRLPGFLVCVVDRTGDTDAESENLEGREGVDSGYASPAL